jgi:tetratricopeptide (TPR) repeat protein
LLVTEISGIEHLLGGTPATAPDHVQITRRLAEDYGELESAAFAEKTRAEIQRDNLRKTNPVAAGQQQTIADGRNQIMLAARQKVIETYTAIVNQHPQYGLLDEVLYYLAYEYEQSNDLVNARRVYYDLIKKKPNSKYIPNAYLAFGELFFNDAQGDPSKWDFAAQAYTEVIKFPPAASKVYGYAWYKLAYVFWNKGELDKALNAFKKTIDELHAVPGREQARGVGPARRHSGLRAQGRSVGRVQLLPQHLGRLERHVQDDGRSRSELPRHRPLSRVHHALPRPHGAQRRQRGELPLSNAHHRGDARDEVGQQGRDARRARQPAQTLQGVR